jgi:osmotically-inducible protein OsmY
MARRYEDRDYDRGQRDYGRRSDSDYERSYGERSESRNRYGRDENEREGYSRESRWGGQSGRGRYSGSEYGGSEYGGRSRSGGSQYGGGQYGSSSQSRSRGEYRGREGYRPGSENDWDYTDDRESRYGSFVRGYDTGAYDDSSRQDNWSSASSSRYNYPSGYRSGDTYRDRGRGYDYGYDRRDEERGWLDRLADKLAAWFGDEDAERRYRMDDERQRHQGKGPKSYRRSDERIREDVNEQLSEGYLDATNVEVAVAEGVVTLTGTVNSRSDKRRAEDIADEVRGVKNVENRLRVEQSDIDRYPSLHGTSSSMGTAGITGTTGTTGTTGSTESTSTARGKTAGT